MRPDEPEGALLDEQEGEHLYRLVRQLSDTIAHEREHIRQNLPSMLGVEELRRLVEPFEEARGIEEHFARDANSAARMMAELERQHVGTRDAEQMLQTWSSLYDWGDQERRQRRLLPKAVELGTRGWTVPIRWGATALVGLVDEVPREEIDDLWLGFYTAEAQAEFDALVDGIAGIRFLDPWRRY